MTRATKKFWGRFTSRKFVVSFLTQITAILVLLFPGQGEVIGQASESVTALVVILLSSLGYITVEGAIDRKSRDKETDGAVEVKRY